jgi:hypothetical protein
MKVYQIICIFSGRGFKTVSVTEGVSENEIREIESSVIPPHAGKDSEGEEVQSQPLYSFFKLESGRYCICMVKFMGGNEMDFLCHGLIPDEGYWPFYPVQLWGSKTFIDDYEMGEEQVCSLPVLDNVLPGTAVTYDNVCQFAAKRLEHGLTA